jgi:hypothetical protein
MKEVVAEPPNYQEDCEQAVAWIVIATVDNRPDDNRSIGRTQMQMFKVVGEGDISEIALPEIGQLRVILVRVESSGSAPVIHLRADQIRASKVTHDLGIKQASQKDKVENLGGIRFRELLKSGHFFQ